MQNTFETREPKLSLQVSALGLLLTLSAASPLAVWAAEPMAETSEPEPPVLRTTIIQTEHARLPGPIVNTGDVRVVAPGTVLEMVLGTEIESYETKAGDEFFGKIIKDVMVDGRVVIPRGSTLHGELIALEEPKRAGRDGYINTRFDYLLTPDGRTISIEGNSTTKDSKGKAAAKVVGRAAAYTAVGGVVGTVIGLQLGGVAGAVASHGGTVAGGAAVGGAAGLTLAMLTKGQSVKLPPGAEMHVKLSEELKLPTMTMPEETAGDFNVPGLEVKVAEMRVDRHPFGEMTEIKLKLDILNDTQNTFSMFDIGLEDELGNLFFASPLADSGVRSIKVKPNTRIDTKITFSVYNSKIRHKLVLFKPFSREPLARLALTDGMLENGKAHKSKRMFTVVRQSK
jgi:hypothetical protein